MLSAKRFPTARGNGATYQNMCVQAQIWVLGDGIILGANPLLSKPHTLKLLAPHEGSTARFTQSMSYRFHVSIRSKSCPPVGQQDKSAFRAAIMKLVTLQGTRRPLPPSRALCKNGTTKSTTSQQVLLRVQAPVQGANNLGGHQKKIPLRGLSK